MCELDPRVTVRHRARHFSGLVVNRRGVCCVAAGPSPFVCCLVSCHTTRSKARATHCVAMPRAEGYAATAPCAVDAGDTAWVILCSILVLGMMPAVAFFEAGLLRGQNTVSIISQIFGGLPLLTLIWIVCGAGLTFGQPSNGFVGSFSQHLFLQGVSAKECIPFYSLSIPSAVFFLFEIYEHE